MFSEKIFRSFYAYFWDIGQNNHRKITVIIKKKLSQKNFWKDKVVFNACLAPFNAILFFSKCLLYFKEIYYDNYL